MVCLFASLSFFSFSSHRALFNSLRYLVYMGSASCFIACLVFSLSMCPLCCLLLAFPQSALQLASLFGLHGICFLLHCFGSCFTWWLQHRTHFFADSSTMETETVDDGKLKEGAVEDKALSPSSSSSSSEEREKMMMMFMKKKQQWRQQHRGRFICNPFTIFLLVCHSTHQIRQIPDSFNRAGQLCFILCAWLSLFLRLSSRCFVLCLSHLCSLIYSPLLLLGQSARLSV